MDSQQSERLGEVESAYRQQLEQHPNHPGVLNSLGNLFLDSGRISDAEQSYRQALILGSESAEIHSNLGMVLVQLGRAQEAEEACRRALKLNPGLEVGYLNLGYALGALGRHLEAEQCYRQLLAINPAAGLVHCNLGNTYKQLGRVDEAEQSLRRALALEPGYAPGHFNLGVLLLELGRLDEALGCFLQAQVCNPDFAEAHVAEASIRLATGDLIGGWEKHDYRWRVRNGPVQKDLPQPVWTGSEDLRGKTILLHAEQGLGDTILFLRYASLVATRAASVLLEVPRILLPLLEGFQGADRVSAQGERLPPFDFHCPLLSLPAAFKTTVESIPASVPYLAFNRTVASNWRGRLAGSGKMIVGVCWRGSADYSRDRERSIDIRQVIPLLECPHVHFVSLQKDLNEQERTALAGVNVTHIGADFVSTAQLIAAVDLVITVDTAWAHWSGAIGKPVWVLLAKSPFWYWLVGREDCPWYPTARLFRQSEFGIWETVIDRARRELERLATNMA